MSSNEEKIPTIDFCNEELKPNTPQWESTRIKVVEALQEYGCFEAIYDRVPNKIREGMYGTSKEIFEFPLETKLKNVSKKPLHGYIGMIPQLPLYESLCIDDLLNPQSVETFANIFWPHGNPDFCNLVKSYSNPLVELDEMVKRMILENLGLKYHIDEFLDPNCFLFRITHYKAPSINGDENNKPIGLDGHTDGNFLTIISQNQVNGLQILKKSGEWIDVNIPPNSYVVLSGDSFMVEEQKSNLDFPFLRGKKKEQRGLMGKGGSEENMAAWLLGVNTLKIQPFNLPALGPRDVRVRMKAVGICGSDVHYLKTLRCADFVVKEPMVIGHECAGIIEEVGGEVKTLVPGDRVALEPGISCWRCDLCKEGRYNLCPEMRFFATPPVHGSLANQVVHPADLCFKLPDNISLEEGAMCEPLSVGVHACRRANVGPETNILVLGAGPIGLVTLLAARAFGAPRIVILDVDDYRLSVAKKLGADDVVKVSINIQDVATDIENIQKAMGGGIDVSFDCAGFNKTMSTALGATRPGGKVCLVGMGHHEMTVPLTPAAAREVDVIGIFRYKNTWPLCLEFLRSGKIDVKPLITHRFGFSQKEVEEAFETSARGGDAIKVMFNL